jgi:hypothetical protein
MNVRSFSNETEVLAWLHGGVAGFDFNSSCGGKPLAQAIQENHVQQIQERSLGEQRGPMLPFKENDPVYAERKAEEYGSDLINYRTGAMLSKESLEGQLQVNGTEMTHLYGTGQPGDPEQGRRSKPTRPGRKPRKTKAEPTDIQKANWAEEQGRGFFGLDDQIKDRNGELVGEALAEHLRNR